MVNKCVESNYNTPTCTEGRDSKEWVGSLLDEGCGWPKRSEETVWGKVILVLN